MACLVLDHGKHRRGLRHRSLLDSTNQNLANGLRGRLLTKSQSDHQSAHLVTLHCTTGIAARQPVRPPTAPGRSTVSRSRVPPWRACLAIRIASVSNVTELTTSRPPGGRACHTASSTPSRLAPPPTNTAS